MSSPVVHWSHVEGASGLWRKRFLKRNVLSQERKREGMMDHDSGEDEGELI